ncbi:MAG: restriction endonuclease subunit S [Melioribacteraceae bacterium]|nr:restriction endonuclease subunit S [Melioribacteraceae bacterium]MCF8355037.1 restriction endonuclease subunit S [Melioribacteraceae bacterium]MCF8392716.1 restriction endonuclease subunit S [Melioribacteraceae bacterium]MCF8417738.1 restriction endonuclease subunit S [Melioribacteraceae bacterium]
MPKTKNKHTKPSYKKTKLGWIPNDWEVKKIKEITLVDKNSLNGNTDPNYRLNYISLADIDNGRLINEPKEIIFSEAPSRARRIVSQNSIILATVRPNLQSFYIQRENKKDIICSTGFAVLDSKNNYDPNYIYHYLFSHAMSAQFYALVVGSNYPAINSTDVKNLKMAIPVLLTEQQKIAQILSAWDRAIEIQTKLIEKYELRKKALTQQLLTGKKRFEDFVEYKGYQKTKIGEVPKDWKILSAKEIFENVSIKKNNGEELLAVTQENGVVPRSMLEGRVMMPTGDTKSYKLVEPGNFVISLRSFQGGIEYSDYRGIVSPAYTVLKNKIDIDKRFFKYFFKSDEFISRLAVAVIGIRDGKQIAYNDFTFMNFRLPSLKEQQKIADVLEAADNEIKVMKETLEKLKEQKKGLMQQLLSGKTRVKVKEEE